MLKAVPDPALAFVVETEPEGVAKEPASVAVMPVFIPLFVLEVSRV